MNKFRDIFTEEVINSVIRIGKSKIIGTSSNRYCIKRKVDNVNKKLFKYLEQRNFNCFVPLIDEIDDISVFKFLEDKGNEINDKAIDLVIIMSMLHNKTTNYQNVVLDEVKEIYERQLELINYLRMYYEDLQDYIEKKVYMSPGEYLLMRHISEIYLALDYSYKMLEEWYTEKRKLTTERIVQLHNNLSVDHLIQSDNDYLISWDKTSKGIVIYDFISFYKNDYLKLEMNSLYRIYQSKFKFNSCEEKLFFSLLSMPWKIDFLSNNLDNSIKCLNLVRYVIKTREFILKENEKYQEADK